MKGRLTLLALTLVAASGGCGAGKAALPAPASTQAAPTSTATAPTSAEAVAATTTTWTTGTVTVTHNPAVPPVPVVTGIRYASHTADGYDRIVFDIPGPLPGYTAKYVTEVIQDGSGKPVSVPGAVHLTIVLTPAQAHRDNGTVTVSGIHTVNLPTLKSYAVVGDYEGYVTIALGLNNKHGYHVAELANRIYIDVAN
jgi:hypothetical protein